jgi:hypothetical protein
MAIISCRTPRFIYSPAPPNNPYFREKGESKLAAYYSVGGDDDESADEYNEGFDLQAAYAISNHFALTADYFKRNEKDSIDNYDRSYFDLSAVRYRRHLTNFGGGYFTPITNDKKITINVFGGYGFGKFSFTDVGISNGTNYSRQYSSDMNRWYIQPSINFFPTGYFRTGLISKFSRVHYSNISTSYTPDELIYLDLDRLPGRTLTFLEATWNMQVTFKKMNWLYLEGGISLSTDPYINAHDDNGNSNLEARNLNLSIGVSLDFSKMKRNDNHVK